TAFFGFFFKLQRFFFLRIFGLNNGLIPVLAFNYGAKKKDRIDEALKFSVKLALTIMCIGTLIFLLIPGALLSLFNASDNMRSMGVIALRIVSLHFPIAAVSIVLGSVFQAFSRSYYSLVISLTRQLIVLIPAAWLLARITGNVNMVWWSFPIAEIVSGILSVTFFRIVYRGVIAKL
ncbi:MAG: MATE family efflux transporter, partial [Firmicutes bacterium]|nr:MATE family efflux transporter [Bacillota bacterium]